MITEQKVRLIATDRRYRLEPYPSIAIYNDTLGTYITGQHIDPDKPETHNNLTIREMIGEVPLSADKAKRFPHVIIPYTKDAKGEITELRHPLINLREYNLSKDELGNYINPKDAAELKFAQLQNVVAPSKELARKGIHYFYLENKEAEAEQRVNIRELRFKAEKLIIESANINQYRDLAILLNYKIKDFDINIQNMSQVMVQDKILDACDKNPQAVISCFDKGVEEELFILKAAHYKIITMKGKSFFDGPEYLGDSVDEVKKFIHSERGTMYVNRWVRQLSEHENMGHEKEDVNNDRYFDELLDKISRAIIMEDFDKAKTIIAQAEAIKADDPMLKKLIEKMNKPADTTDNDKADKMNIGRLKKQCERLNVDKDKYENESDIKVLKQLIEDKKNNV